MIEEVVPSDYVRAVRRYKAQIHHGVSSHFSLELVIDGMPEVQAPVVVNVIRAEQVVLHIIDSPA